MIDLEELHKPVNIVSSGEVVYVTTPLAQLKVLLRRSFSSIYRKKSIFRTDDGR